AQITVIALLARHAQLAGEADMELVGVVEAQRGAIARAGETPRRAGPAETDDGKRPSTPSVRVQSLGDGRVALGSAAKDAAGNSRPQQTPKMPQRRNKTPSS